MSYHGFHCTDSQSFIQNSEIQKAPKTKYDPKCVLLSLNQFMLNVLPEGFFCVCGFIFIQGFKNNSVPCNVVSIIIKTHQKTF